MRPPRIALALVTAALPCVAIAQEVPPDAEQPRPAARARTWQFTPRISLREEYTDNLRQTADAIAQSGWISELVPGLRLDHEGPRLRLSADYAYDRYYYSGASDLDNSQNFLNAAGAYQIYERNVSVEGRASITQENRSAFAAAVIPGSVTSNANRVETRLLGISPIVRGQFGDFAIWRARYNETEVSTRAESNFAATRQRTSEVLAGARNAAAGARVGWALEATALRARADSTGDLDDRRIRADLVFGLAPQLHVLLIGGYERTDFTREGTTSGSTPGGGIEWSPGPRTQFAGVAQHRFFGTGHLVTFDHRTARTAFRLSSTKDSTVLTSVLGTTSGTLQSLMENLLLASIPDPLARSEAARARLAQLGTAPTSVSTGFLTERPFVFDSQEASFTLIGNRNTFVAAYQRRVQTALGDAVGLGDSFTLSEEIRQRNWRVGLVHQLTPRTSFSLAYSDQRANGVEPSNVSTREDLFTFFLSSQLGPRTTGSLGVRRVEFESNQTPGYRQNSVFGSLSFRL